MEPWTKRTLALQDPFVSQRGKWNHLGALLERPGSTGHCQNVLKGKSIEPDLSTLSLQLLMRGGENAQLSHRIWVRGGIKAWEQIDFSADR